MVVDGAQLRELSPPLVARMELPESVAVTRPLLAYDRVRFVGEPVAVVVAESRALAEDAAALADIDYELLDPVVDAERASKQGHPCSMRTFRTTMPATSKSRTATSMPPSPPRHACTKSASTLAVTLLRHWNARERSPTGTRTPQS